MLVKGTKKNVNAVLGAVYPAVSKYLPDYFESLQRQTCRDFDLLLVKDGLDVFQRPEGLNVIELEGEGAPARIRETVINHALQSGYECLVFSDTDDYFSPDRVAQSLRLLKEYDIVVNDLSLVSENGDTIVERYLSRRLGDMEEIALGHLIHRNMMGLSNTAVSRRCFDVPLRLDSETIAVDWYLFSTLLLEGRSAVFTDRAVTYYRQHGSNTAGLGGELTTGALLRGVEIKAQHYGFIAILDESFIDLANEYRDLKNEIKKSNNIQAYREAMLAQAVDDPLWWENARLWRRESK